MAKVTLSKLGYIKILSYLSLLLLTSCAKRDPRQIYAGQPADVLYAKAVKLIPDEDALDPLSVLLEDYPQNPLHIKAQLLKVYVLYINSKFDDAIDEAELFIKLYPADKNIDYVYYIRAICYYDRVRDAKRDQEIALQARDTLKAFLNSTHYIANRSKYFQDVSEKLKLTLDILAAKEMEIGRFYLRQGNFIAATNRFNTVIELYSDTSLYPEAVYRIIESCCLMGLYDEAKAYFTLFQKMNPDRQHYHFWYDASATLIRKIPGTVNTTETTVVQ